jgi:hypothetical protein
VTAHCPLFDSLVWAWMLSDFLNSTFLSRRLKSAVCHSTASGSATFAQQWLGGFVASRNESTICCVAHGAAKGWQSVPVPQFQSSHHHAMSHVAIHVNRCQSLGFYHVVWEYCCSKAFSQLLAQFAPKIAVRRRRLILSNNRAPPHATCPLYLDFPHVRR